MKNKIIGLLMVLLFVIVTLIFDSRSLDHAGEVNSDGCHNGPVGYHCHR